MVSQVVGLRPSITDTPVATWNAEETSRWGTMEEYASKATYDAPFSAYNPTPGTGRTGFSRVQPNNYPFYSVEERYSPVVQSDGGQLSEWKPMYAPSKEQAELDRAAAYASGVPHGYLPPGDKYTGAEIIELWIQSDLHSAAEYGMEVDVNGEHHGGPFTIHVSTKMRVEELRLIIRDKGGIIPALQKLSYAGKNLDDPQRTLEHYGIAYWHARFPHWPLKIRKM